MIKDPFPLRTQLGLALRYKPQLKYIPKAAIYTLMILFTLPFHWLELIFYRERIDRHEPDKAPLFILGHWRSGTTYMLRLMSKDPNLAYLNQFHAFLPLGSFVHERIYSPLVTFIFKTLKMKHPIHGIPMVNEFPAEEDIGFVCAGAPTSPMWGHMYSEYADYFFERFLTNPVGSPASEDFKEMYDYFARRLSFFSDSRRLLLKSPANTCKVPELLALYPDAKFIYIEREPADVYFSYLKLLRANRTQWLQEMPESEMTEYFIRWYPQVMGRYYQTRNRIPKENLVELKFEDLYSRPKEILDEIYEQFGLERSEELDRIHNAFLEAQHGKQRYYYEKEIPAEVQEMFDEFHQRSWEVVAD